MLALVRHLVPGKVGQRWFVCGLEVRCVVWNDKTAIWIVLSLSVGLRVISVWAVWGLSMLFLSSSLSLFPFLYSCFFRLKLSSRLYFHLVIFYIVWVFMSVWVFCMRGHLCTTYMLGAWRRWCSSLWVTMGIEPESFATRVLNHWVCSPVQCPGS